MDKRKNILLITSDQQHWNTLGMLNDEIKTPNLDRLAKSGTLFSRAYCPNPTCTPTRASIITGLHPSSHGAYSLGTKLPESVHTVTEDFHAGGYRSALIGKAHFQQLLDTPQYPSIESNPLQNDLDFWRGFNGPFYGFDHVELARNHTDEYHVGQHYALWMESKGFTQWRECFQKPGGTAEAQKHHWNIPEEFHYDAWIAERANNMLQQYADNDENFFLWASFLDPHPPYLAPSPWDRMYDPEKITVPQMHEDEDFSAMPPHYAMTRQASVDPGLYQEPHGNAVHGYGSHLQDKDSLARDISVYYGMISMMDKYIGRIIDRLHALNLAEDTIIVFTTDHGHFFGQHGLNAKCIFNYEDMHKIPFIVAGPGVPKDRQSEAMQSLVDLAPTFLSLCDIPVPISMTGKDQKAVWLGKEKSVRDHVIIENRHQPTTMYMNTYVGQRYKITVYYNQVYGELFDLHADPGELKNLWDSPEHQELKKELLQKLIHAKMINEPLSMPRVCCA